MNFTRIKSVLKVGLIFLAGVLVGGMTLAVLSSRASTEYLAIVKMNYEMQQELDGYRALHQQDYPKAVWHFTNLVSSQEGDQALAFQEAVPRWPLSFPFVAVILKKIRAANNPQGIAKNRVGGDHHYRVQPGNGSIDTGQHEFGMRPSTVNVPSWHNQLSRSKRDQLSSLISLIITSGIAALIDCDYFD